MTYGIEVNDPSFSTAPKLSSDYSQRGLVISAAGTSDVVEIPSDALLAVKAPTVSSGSFIGVTAVRDNLSNGNYEYTFREIQQNSGSLSVGMVFNTTVTLEYLVLRGSDLVTATGTQGVQIFSGSQKQFDSRHFKSGNTVTVEYNFVQGTWNDGNNVISYSNSNKLYFFANWFGHQASGSYPNGQGLNFSNSSTNYGDAIRVISYQTNPTTGQRNGLTFGGGITLFERKI